MITWAGLAPTASAISTTVGSASSLPRPNGDQDCVTMPICACIERSSD